MMTPESRDKLDSTLTPRLLNLTLESEISRKLLGVCYKWDVLVYLYYFQVSSCILACPGRRYDGWSNFHAKLTTWRCRGGPASLGCWPHVTALLLVSPDALLVSVEVAYV
jgi:hypothetical protein